jgi:hypothetical protein
MNIISKVAIGITGSVALASGVFYGTREPKREVGALEISDHATSLKVVKTAKGKQVKLVTGSAIGDKKATEFGDAELVEEQDGNVSVPNDAICNIIFFAKVIKKNGKAWPDVEGIEQYLNAGTTPVLVRLDDDIIGNTGVWNSLFRGLDCVWAADNLDYAGSDVQQLINHPKRNVLLRTFAKAGAKDSDGNSKGVVEFEDIDADPNADIFFGHSWFGRADVNFSVYKAGKIVSFAEVEKLEKEVEDQKALSAKK